MAIALSALSLAANEMRGYLSTIAGLARDRVLISHPKEAFETAADKEDHYLNLFFYNIEHGAFPADGTNEEPFYVRLHCLITALSADDSSSGGASAGENDLRLTGEVMRLLHEKPRMTVANNGTTFAELDVVLHPMTLDDINRIWSTQGDTPYRLSVAYELALVPVPLAEVLDTSLRVGATGVQALPGIAAPLLPEEGFAVESVAPRVPRVTVDGSRADWAPHIAFETDGLLGYTQARSVADLPLKANLAVAGAVGETITLAWEVWSSESGWKELSGSPSETVVIQTDTIDPNNIEAGSLHAIVVPLSAAGQAMLYAVREITRPGTTTPLIYRSNPLLITVCGPTSP